MPSKSNGFTLFETVEQKIGGRGHIADSRKGRRLLVVAWLSVFVAVTIFAIVVACIGDSAGRSSASILVWATTVIVLALSGFDYVSSRRDPTRLLRPLAAPLIYLAYALLLPLLYISVTGNGIQVMPPAMFTPRTAAAMSLTVLAFCGGVALARISRGSGPMRPKFAYFAPSSYDREVSLITRDLGRVLLVISLSAKIYEWVTIGPVSSRIYGADQLQYDSTTAISTIGASLVAVGCLLVFRGNSIAYRRPLTLFDGLLISILCAVSLFVLGSRAEVIAPIMLLLWFWLKSGRTIRLSHIVAGAGSIATLFLLAAEVRSRNFQTLPFSPVENLLVETSSPIYLTFNVLAVQPAHHAFLEGSTYLAALQNMLPGPIGRALFGNVQGTGALAYRDLINYTNPRQGWGFSLPTEGYVNFGFAGIIISAALVGFFFNRAYQNAQERSEYSGLSSFVYALLLSYLPYGLRSDALGQLKSVVYPIIIVVVALIIARLFVRRQDLRSFRGPKNDDRMPIRRAEK